MDARPYLKPITLVILAPSHSRLSSSATRWAGTRSRPTEDAADLQGRTAAAADRVWIEEAGKRILTIGHRIQQLSGLGIGPAKSYNPQSFADGRLVEEMTGDQSRLLRVGDRVR